VAIVERLAAIRERIDAALKRGGDPGRDVTIIAVTKGHPAEIVDQVAAAGLLDVGENRVQELVAKAPLVRADVRWHMIGHLQRNKAARAAELCGTIHSVDSERLARALGATGRALRVFLQVNVSGEASKSGVVPEELPALWRAALAADPLEVAGLMTMAPYSEDPEAARPVFRALRQLRDDLVRTGDGPPFSGLSMGMSGDYAVAVEEGATHVRIGTALVGRKRVSPG
jgi:pyridoxal phosphate enzyme (YggS family)